MKPARFLALLCFAAVVVLVMTACSTIATPQTLDQRLAYAYGSVTATRYTCADAVQRQRVDKAAAQQCLLLTDHARKTVDAARTLVIAGQPGDAQAQLTLALDILASVERMMQERLQEQKP